MASSTQIFNPDLSTKPAEYAQQRVKIIREAYVDADANTCTGTTLSVVSGECSPSCLLCCCCASLACCMMLCIPLASYHLCRNITPEEVNTLKALEQELDKIAKDKAPIILPESKNPSSAQGLLFFPADDARLLTAYSRYTSYPKDSREPVAFFQLSLWKGISEKDAKSVAKQAAKQHAQGESVIDIAALQQEARAKSGQGAEEKAAAGARPSIVAPKPPSQRLAARKDKALRTIIAISNTLMSSTIKASKLDLETLRASVANAHRIDINTALATTQAYQACDHHVGTGYKKL